MTKSAVALARETWTVATRALPRYANKYSRHDYTQAQLLALLVLKQFLQTDYRGLVALVGEWGEVRRTLRLRRVPHPATLCRAEQRLLRGAEKGGPSASSSTRSRPAPARTGCSAPPRSSSRSMRRGSRAITSASTSASAAARGSGAASANGRGRS